MDISSNVGAFGYKIDCFFRPISVRERPLVFEWTNQSEAINHYLTGLLLKIAFFNILTGDEPKPEGTLNISRKER